MPRGVLILCVSAFLAGAARADEEGRDVFGRKLQEQSEKIATEVGPAIARIYVSRSDAYANASFWGNGKRPDSSGHLGRFDREAAEKRVPADARHRKRILRTLRDHDLSDPGVVPESYGSGIVVDRSGLILTNAHVVRNATKVYVRLPKGKSSWADIYASDPRSDLAVLKLLDPPAGLKAVTLGDGGKVRQGQVVLSMSNPYTPRDGDDEAIMSYGLVSALRRKAPGNPSEMERSKVTLHHYGTLIQTGARTTPGCSGGALLDLEGKVVGLTTALAGVSSDRPGGYAIPFDTNTQRIIETLKRGEEVEYGFLGVVLQELRGSARLYRVSPGSPAAGAGLAPNDRIVSIDGHPVNNNEDLFLFIGMALAGSTVKVEIERGKLLLPVKSIKLAKFYVPGPVLAAKRPPARFGLRVDYTSIICQRNPFPLWHRPPAKGVVIREVIPDSPADKARLQPDKIITRVNGEPVASPKEYYRQMARLSGREKVELTYLNSDGAPMTITLEEK
jgi:serine protease Do